MSKNETGGGDGVEVVFNEPFDASPHPTDGYFPANEPVDPQLPASVSGRRRGVPHSLAPSEPLLNGDPRWYRGQYTLKWYHLTRFLMFQFLLYVSNEQHCFLCTAVIFSF